MSDADSTAFLPIPKHVRFKDLTGRTFGRLTVLGYIGQKDYGQFWLCRCSCGAEKAIYAYSLMGNRTFSCGCQKKEHSAAAIRIRNTCQPIVSDEDSDLLLLYWRLSHAGYAVRNSPRTNGKRKNAVFLHRIILERKIGRPLVQGELCDHINRVPLDNRRENLRVADRSLNRLNSKDIIAKRLLLAARTT